MRKAAKANGFWAVQVACDGVYEFELRRWSKELDKPINANIPGAKAINAVRARLKVADVDTTMPVPSDVHSVAFRTRLKAGKTRVQTWFVDADGTSRGAYYLYVKRL